MVSSGLVHWNDDRRESPLARRGESLSVTDDYSEPSRSDSQRGLRSTVKVDKKTMRDVVKNKQTFLTVGQDTTLSSLKERGAS